MAVDLKQIPDKKLRRLFEKKRRGGLEYKEVVELIKNTYDFGKITEWEFDGLSHIRDHANLDVRSKNLLTAFLKSPNVRPIRAVENLCSSRLAVKYVDRKMTIGAANKPWSSEESKICVKSIRRGGYSSIRERARKAAEGGCGNCGEQAALAFVFLARRGIRPLDYMSLSGSGDHAFVVIGRMRRGPAHKPRKWGPFAVVCDPWMRTDGKWFKSTYYGSRYFPLMYDTMNMPESVARID